MSANFFKHYRIGYKQNPFSALTRQEWGETAFVPNVFRELLFESNVHIQLLGRIGSGKTSLMHRIIEEYFDLNCSIIYEYIPEGQTRFKTKLEQVDLFLLDEAQRLNWWWRRKWLNRLSSPPNFRTVFTSHQDLSTYFYQKKILLKSLTIDEIISPEYYAQWIEKRLAYFEIPNAAKATFTIEAFQFLNKRFDKDLRSAEYFLYEVFEDLETAVSITPQLLADFLIKYPPVPSPEHHK